MLLSLLREVGSSLTQILQIMDMPPFKKLTLLKEYIHG